MSAYLFPEAQFTAHSAPPAVGATPMKKNRREWRTEKKGQDKARVERIALRSAISPEELAELDTYAPSPNALTTAAIDALVRSKLDAAEEKAKPVRALLVGLTHLLPGLWRIISNYLVMVTPSVCATVSLLLFYCHSLTHLPTSGGPAARRHATCTPTTKKLQCPPLPLPTQDECTQLTHEMRGEW